MNHTALTTGLVTAIAGLIASAGTALWKDYQASRELVVSELKLQRDERARDLKSCQTRRDMLQAVLIQIDPARGAEFLGAKPPRGEE